MKKYLALISLLMLTIAAMAQTLTITEGKVIYQYPASLTGDMTFDNGTMLTILGKSFTLADVSISVNSENIVDENIVIKESGEGGTIELGFPSPLSLEVQVQPEDALSWISVKSVVALQNMQTIELLLKPNASASRSATVIVKSKDETFGLTYLINQNVDEQLVADIAAFVEYKTTQKTAADALAQEGDSEACLTLISDAKADIDALEYDETKTLEENKAAIDAIIKSLAEALAVQRENDSWINTVPPDDEIWYTTKNNTILNLEESYPLYNPKPFDSNIISHTYENGIGIIKCDRAITIINDHVFGNSLGEKISHISLPNSICILHTGALRNIGVEELRIPDNLKAVGSYALNSNCIKRFIGNHTSTDGKCVIIEDGLMPNYGNTLTPIHNYMAAFAPSGVSQYSLPSQVEILGWYVFAWCPELREISFNEGLKVIMGDCFVNDYLDCDIILPSTLEELNPYAFRACMGIKGVFGNEKFHTSDHLCLTFEQNAYDWTESENNGTWINRFFGYDITDYSIPEGIKGIENYSFDNMPNLKTVTFPSSIAEIGSYAFNHCDNLQAVYGECVSEDHKAIVFGTQFRKLIITKGVVSYTVPNGITSIGYGAFEESPELEEVIIPDGVTQLGGYDFGWCKNLKRVVLSSQLETVKLYNPFLGSNQLEEIYFRSYLPPIYTDTQFNESDCSHLTVYVPEETLELYKLSGWSQFAPYMVGYKYDDIGEWNPDYYLSTDYSLDGATTTLQQSSTGAGIDLVLMGDAFSDRQIADGTYGNVMQKAMDAFFSEEPYKSMKDRFNVYAVNVVSVTEGYEHAGQALNTGHGNGTYVFGNDNKVVEYAKKAIGEDRLDDALIIVMMNEDAYAGTCFMYNPPSGNYGRGLSIAYFPTSSDTETFNGLVSHEAGGHGFAKLADEYAYEYMGVISADAITNTKAAEPYGWWKNVDFTSDPAEVKWSQFLSDSRYANEGLGCFEGGLTYWSGVWRPTENSIMRNNTGGFNAPSRYAIWYRIGKLAYGENWEGSYEDFVAYDAINRTKSAEARRKAQMRRALQKSLPQLPPPVVVGHNWREELQKTKVNNVDSSLRK